MPYALLFSVVQEALAFCIIVVTHRTYIRLHSSKRTGYDLCQTKDSTLKRKSARF